MSDILIRGGTLAAPDGEIFADIAGSATEEDATVAIDEIARFVEPLADDES